MSICDEVSVWCGDRVGYIVQREMEGQIRNVPEKLKGRNHGNWCKYERSKLKGRIKIEALSMCTIYECCADVIFLKGVTHN